MIEPRTTLAQRGAALLEAALTLSLFLTLVCGIVEFTFYQLDANRAAAASRALIRYAITNDPVCDLAGGCPGEAAALTCPGGAPVSVTLDQVAAACTADSTQSACRMLRIATVLVPRAQPQNVRVTYACSDAGFGERPQPIPLVTVTIAGVPHTVVTAGLVGFDPTLILPTASSSRTGEDMASRRGT